MAFRNRTRRRFWPLLIGLTLVALLVGWAIGGILGGNILPRIPFLYHAPRTAVATPAAPAANDDDLKTMSRAKLESEVRRLRTDLADKNRQLDDLQIQIKLLNEGSRTGK
jgi:hypothetical protein